MQEEAGVGVLMWGQQGGVAKGQRRGQQTSAGTGAGQRSPLICSPQLRPGPCAILLSLELRLFSHPVLTSEQAGGCPAPPLHPRTCGHPKTGGSTPGTCCWGAAESRDQQGAQILPRAPLCLASMPTMGDHQHPATLLGMAWPASVSRVRRTGGTAPILTTASCRLIVKSLRRTMGPVNPFTMGLIANQTDFTLAVPLAMRLHGEGLLGWGVGG